VGAKPVKRIHRYLSGTLDYDLLFRPSLPSELVIYIDIGWTGCPDMRWSTSGYTMFLGANLVFWFLKWWPFISHSSTKAEYCVVTNGVTEVF
jgi:hypothetical protein